MGRDERLMDNLKFGRGEGNLKYMYPFVYSVIILICGLTTLPGQLHAQGFKP
jgi:hypothetical protein